MRQGIGGAQLLPAGRSESAARRVWAGREQVASGLGRTVWRWPARRQAHVPGSRAWAGPGVGRRPAGVASPKSRATSSGHECRAEDREAFRWTRARSAVAASRFPGPRGQGDEAHSAGPGADTRRSWSSRRSTGPGGHADSAGRRGRRRRARPGRPAAVAAPAALPDHDDREPEGRGRQDDHGGQPGRQPGAARLAGPGDGPGPAGERVDRAGRRPPRRVCPSVYDVLVDDRPLAEVVRPAGDMPGLYCAPATIDLAGRGDRTGPGGGAGSFGWPARCARSTRRTLTTCSSTARRRSGC